MIDREKVVDLLNEMAEYFENCRHNASFGSKAEEHFYELRSAARDVLELLKEQEPVLPRMVKRYIAYSDTAVNFVDSYDCGSCGEELPDNAKYCPKCGRPVKWND